MKVYKQCFNSCKTCDIEGNINKHNCKICKDNFNFEMPYENYKNCYEICENYYYYDEINNISKCTKTPECPIDYNKLILEEKKCIDYFGKNFNYKYEFQNRCYINCPNNSTVRTNITFLGFFYDKYFCKPICNELNPFEIIKSQSCVKNCDIKLLNEHLCEINYLPKNYETKEENNKKQKKK